MATPAQTAAAHRGTRPVTPTAHGTSNWTERSLIGATVGQVSGSHGVRMAVNVLIDKHIDRLGKLLAKSDDELQAVRASGPPRWRPSAR